MTDLEEFLTALYDSLADAELRALKHGHRRYAEAREAGLIREDASLPVYHATNLHVDLDVGLEAKIDDDGARLIVTEPPTDDEDVPSGLRFETEVFELIDHTDLEPPERDPDDADRGDKTWKSHRISLRRPEYAPIEPEKEQPESESEEPAAESDTERDLTVLDGIGEARAAALREAGFTSLKDIRTASPDELAAVEGIWRELATRAIEEATTRTHQRSTTNTDISRPERLEPREDEEATNE